MCAYYLPLLRMTWDTEHIYIIYEKVVFVFLHISIIFVLEIILIFWHLLLFFFFTERHIYREIKWRIELFGDNEKEKHEDNSVAKPKFQKRRMIWTILFLSPVPPPPLK